MNDFFIRKVKNLRENLTPNLGDPLSLLRRLMANRDCSLKLKIISKRRPSSSCGLDLINSKIIKLARHQLVPVITHLINLSISSQRFPESWKVSKVVPLHKKEEAIYPKNYRPVSLLPVLSKILERVVFEQMISYLEEFQLLHPSHHGFRAGHSTVTTLIEINDQWVEAFERDEVTAVVMLDISAAFDVVDHNILLQKLEILGFKEGTIAWLRSYLTGRSQKVYIEGFLSEALYLEAGVPQGSIRYSTFFHK